MGLKCLGSFIKRRRIAALRLRPRGGGRRMLASGVIVLLDEPSERQHDEARKDRDKDARTQHGVLRSERELW
jgi:hypothetical protein